MTTRINTGLGSWRRIELPFDILGTSIQIVLCLNWSRSDQWKFRGQSLEVAGHCRERRGQGELFGHMSLYRDLRLLESPSSPPSHPSSAGGGWRRKGGVGGWGLRPEAVWTWCHRVGVGDELSGSTQGLTRDGKLPPVWKTDSWAHPDPSRLHCQTVSLHHPHHQNKSPSGPPSENHLISWLHNITLSSFLGGRGTYGVGNRSLQIQFVWEAAKNLLQLLYPVLVLAVQVIDSLRHWIKVYSLANPVSRHSTRLKIILTLSTFFSL